MTSLTHPPGTAAPETPVAAQTVLTEEMLVRFAKRAPQYDRDNVFFSEDFDELRDAGYLRPGVPKELGGPGCRWPASPGAAAAGVLRRADGAGDQHAPVLDGRRGGSLARRRPSLRVAARSERPPARCSPPAMPRAATTSRCCSPRRRPSASRAAIGSRGANRSAACRRCGRSSACTAWTRAIPARRRSSTPSCRARPRVRDRAHVGRARDARDAQRRHDPGRRLRARSRTSRAWYRPASRAIDLFVLGIFAWALAGLRQHLLRPGAAGAGPDGRAGAEEALDRLSPAR